MEAEGRARRGRVQKSVESLEKSTAALHVGAWSSAFGGAFAEKKDTWGYFVKRSKMQPFFGSDSVSDGQRVIVRHACPLMRFERESHRLSLFACLSESTWFGRASQLDASAPEHARAQGLPGYREPQTFTFDYGEESLSYGGLNERCGTVVQRAEVCSDPWVAKQLEADGKVPPSAVCACDVRVRGVCVWSPPPKGASPGRESL